MYNFLLQDFIVDGSNIFTIIAHEKRHMKAARLLADALVPLEEQISHAFQLKTKKRSSRPEVSDEKKEVFWSKCYFCNYSAN